MNKWKTHFAAATTSVFILAGTLSAGPTFSFTNFMNSGGGNSSGGQLKPSLNLLVLGQGNVVYNNPSFTETLWGENDGVSAEWGSFTGQQPPVSSAGSNPPVSQSAWRTPRRYGPGPTGFFARNGFRNNPDSPFQWGSDGSSGSSFLNGYSDSDDPIRGNRKYGFQRSWNGFDGSSLSDYCPGFQEPPPPTAAVPTPGSVLLGGIGVGLVGLLRSRKNSALQ